MVNCPEDGPVFTIPSYACEYSAWRSGTSEEGYLVSRHTTAGAPRAFKDVEVHRFFGSPEASAWNEMMVFLTNVTTDDERDNT